MLNSFKLQLAVKILKENKVIALPTDTVFGLSCLMNDLAIKKLLKIKKRSSSKGLIVITNKIENLMFLFKKLPSTYVNYFYKNHHKPTTFLVPHLNLFSPLITGKSSKIAIRIVETPLLDQILNKTKFLISTSANISNFKIARNTLQIRKKLKVDLIINGNTKTTESSLIFDIEKNIFLRK